MPVAASNGIELYYETHGSGEPLVLISGLGYDLWIWHQMVPGLAENFQVITFDNRGCGKSDKPPGAYSADMLAEDTAGLIRALGFEKAHVYGHSMGGLVAQALAINQPEIIDKLIVSSVSFGGPNEVPITAEAMAILSDPNLDPVERLRQGILVAMAPGYGERNPEFVQEWMNYRLQNPIMPEQYQSQYAVGLALKMASVEDSFQLKLKNVQIPTLVLFGEYDSVVPPANAELLAKELPNSTIEILPDSGHIYMFEVPELAVEAATNFLRA
ncbi:MAG: alpha/beta fold hydrolase [Candidatus Promineifilaceae bacterium]|jgi:pimeloyl-ACP methyl ester carboxylesterase